MDFISAEAHLTNQFIIIVTSIYFIERGNKMGKIILEFIKNSMFTINIFLRMFLILLFLDAFSKFYCLQEKRKRREFCHGNIIVRDP